MSYMKEKFIAEQERKGWPVCRRCKGLSGDPNIAGNGICGTCDDDLWDDYKLRRIEEWERQHASTRPEA